MKKIYNIIKSQSKQACIKYFMEIYQPKNQSTLIDIAVLRSLSIDYYYYYLFIYLFILSFFFFYVLNMNVTLPGACLLVSVFRSFDV